jgi:hypothetical protein
MYIFTPNTLIESAKVNANFTEQDDRLTTLETRPYAYGTVGTENGGGIKSLTQTAASGITYNGSNQYTVVTGGVYRLYAQQLIQTSAGTAIYFGWVNSVPAFWFHGYLVPSRQDDVIASGFVELSAGSTIRLSQTNASTASWGSLHSSYYIELVRPT